jgi:hypothetical protein
MTGKELEDIEKSLGRLVPRGIPPDLGRRIIGHARDARKNAVMTPRMRIVAVVCTVLIGAVLGTDPLLGRHESARIAALLGSPGVSNPAGEEIRLLWAELGADLGDFDKLRREGIVLSRMGSRNDPPWAYFEAQDRLKGMIDHEDPENYY